MKSLSLIDKFGVLFHLTKSNIFYPIIIFIFVVISFLFVTTNKNNKKESKRAYGTIYAILIVVTLVKYSSFLPKMFDYMMNNLFIIFYFPNIAVYLGAIVATNIIMWISMFSTKTKSLIKIINSIFFSIIHYIFILILNIISTAKIDVFNQSVLYSNNDIHALIELTSNFFLIWIFFLSIYKIIITYLESKKVERVFSEEMINVEHVKEEGEEKHITIHLPNSVSLIDAPYIIKRDTNKTNIVYNIPFSKENTAIYEQMLTLDDYKLLISLLKEQRIKDVKQVLEKQNEKIIERNKEKNIVHNKEDKKLQNNLTELMALYKSVS